MSRMILLAIIAAERGTLYYSTEQYCTVNADTPANTLFEGRLVDSVYERAVSFPVWDRAGGGQAISYIEFQNTDGGLDDWLGDAWRDVRVVLKIVAQRAAYSTATQVGVVVVDRIEAPTASTIRLVCRSVFERLEKVITTNYPSTITNETLWDRPKPLTLGHVRWLDPSNSRLYAAPVRGVYDIADSYFESITEVRSRGLPATETQITLPTGTQYFVNQDATGYGYLFSTQSYRHAVDVYGQVRRDTQMCTNSTFPTGTGTPNFDPTGWTVSESGASTVTWNSAGNVTIDGQNSLVSLLQTLTTVNGARYQLEIDYSASTGVTQMQAGTVLRSPDGVGPNTLQAVFVAGSTSTAVGISVGAGATANAVITAIRCYRIYRISTLSEIVRFAAVTRGVLSTSDVDFTALDAIDASQLPELGFHSQGGEVRGIDLVQQAAASLGCAIFQNASGELSPVMLDTPAVVADFDLDELQIPGEIGYEFDAAPGLSTRMHYGRNYAPHSIDDMASLTDAALRAELSNEIRTVVTGVTLWSEYLVEAADREPLESLLSDAGRAQDAIDRICALYTVPRAFYTLRAFVDAVATYTIEPGHTVALTHSRYGLSAGKNLLVVLARSDFLGNSVDLVLWG